MEFTGEKPYLLRITRDELETYIRAYLALEKEYGNDMNKLLANIPYEEVDSILYDFNGV